LQHHNDPRDWETEQVCEWLEVSSLGLYSKLFEENGVTGADLFDLNASDLKSLGVPHNDSMRILHQVRQLYELQRVNTV
jgi:hypothetical protein